VIRQQICAKICWKNENNFNIKEFFVLMIMKPCKTLVFNLKDEKCTIRALGN
jgi:hypothetical protein